MTTNTIQPFEKPSNKSLNRDFKGEIKVGDQVRFIQSWLRGRTAQVIEVTKEKSYLLLGDWTQETGFCVPYGPVAQEQIEKL
ncbi:MAG: hypothetical protein SFW36_09230 [Leptolyngbyaceae cyanobacterium bins.59]|nr:hypothetical protein [Leptolyngbyaceae cyanobacterium bins.59]